MTTPQIRENEKLVDATWEEALYLIALKYESILKEHGSGAGSNHPERNNCLQCHVDQSGVSETGELNVENTFVKETKF